MECLARIIHGLAAESAGKKQEDLRRKLTQAETKNQLLQKEILAIVGSGGSMADAAAAATAAEDLERALERARTAEKKLAEIGAAVPDSDLRRKLRESEYRVCELEFKLSEAEEKASQAQSLPATEQPSDAYLAKLHEELALTKQVCEDLLKEKQARG